MSNALNQISGFLRNLAEALHISGMPAHELEWRLNEIGKRLGVHVDSFAVLTMLTLNIVDETGQQRIEMVRLPSYDYNMARLIALEELVGDLDRVTSLENYADRLKAIMTTPPLWHGWKFMVFGFLLSASVAVLLRGGWVEMLCGGLVGMAFVGAFQQLARIPQLGPAIPVLLCTAAAIVAHALGLAFPGQTVFLTAVAGVVFLLPGFTLTVAMSELATQNLLAGSGRLIGAFVLLFMMGAGLAIGSQISLQLFPTAAAAISAPLPQWAMWLAIASLGISLLGVLQAPLRAVHVLVGACLLAWAVYSLVSTALGSVVGAFAGALAVASAGHLYHHLTGQPDVLVKIPGLITLVPGSMGFRGLHALMERDSAIGIGLMTEMLLIGVVLAVGLLLADNISPLLFARLRRKKTA